MKRYIKSGSSILHDDPNYGKRRYPQFDTYYDEDEIEDEIVDANEVAAVVADFDPYIAKVYETKFSYDPYARFARIPILIEDRNSNFSEFISFEYSPQKPGEWTWYWDPTALSLYDFKLISKLAQEITEDSKVHDLVGALINDFYNKRKDKLWR